MGCRSGVRPPPPLPSGVLLSRTPVPRLLAGSKQFSRLEIERVILRHWSVETINGQQNQVNTGGTPQGGPRYQKKKKKKKKGGTPKGGQKKKKKKKKKKK